MGTRTTRFSIPCRTSRLGLPTGAGAGAGAGCSGAGASVLTDAMVVEGRRGRVCAGGCAAGATGGQRVATDVGVTSQRRVYQASVPVAAPVTMAPKRQPLARLSATVHGQAALPGPSCAQRTIALFARRRGHEALAAHAAHSLQAAGLHRGFARKPACDLAGPLRRAAGPRADGATTCKLPA